MLKHDELVCFLCLSISEKGILDATTNPYATAANSLSVTRAANYKTSISGIRAVVKQISLIPDFAK